MHNNYGRFTKLTTLPTGTKFWVRNGCWNGEIVESDGIKYIHIIETNSTRKLEEYDELAIDILLKD